MTVTARRVPGSGLQVRTVCPLPDLCRHRSRSPAGLCHTSAEYIQLLLYHKKKNRLVVSVDHLHHWEHVPSTAMKATKVSSSSGSGWAR